MNIKTVLLLTFIALGCKQSTLSQATGEVEGSKKEVVKNIIHPEGNTLQTRINTPRGYERQPVPTTSFASYLRNIRLKPNGDLVKYYNGSVKENNDVYVAVVDLPIGKKDLHQCADAIMRLRAEYLWKAERYDDIHFNFTNGHKVEYRKWMDGNRMIVSGNKTEWTKSKQPSNTYDDFWSYMELIFTYAGTASLEKELITRTMSDMQIGDVFIKGGYPGHAVIVVDMAVDASSREKIYLLAQSYMPAQELQILPNPIDEHLSPWYKLETGKDVQTPEWIFKSTELRKFE